MRPRDLLKVSKQRWWQCFPNFDVVFRFVYCIAFECPQVCNKEYALLSTMQVVQVFPQHLWVSGGFSWDLVEEWVGRFARNTATLAMKKYLRHAAEALAQNLVVIKMNVSIY